MSARHPCVTPRDGDADAAEGRTGAYRLLAEWRRNVDPNAMKTISHVAQRLAESEMYTFDGVFYAILVAEGPKCVLHLPRTLHQRRHCLGAGELRDGSTAAV